EEVEIREVADVVRIEEDVARELFPSNVLEQPLAAPLELDRRNAGALLRLLVHVPSSSRVAVSASLSAALDRLCARRVGTTRRWRDRRASTRASRAARRSRTASRGGGRGR